MVLDVAPLEALLTRTFSIGLDVGRGKEKAALVRLRLSRALLGAAETQAMAAGALAIEPGVATEQIAAAEGLALHAAAFTGMPDPVLHLAARAMGVVTGLAALERDPRVPGAGVLPDAARQAATGRQQLLAFRHDGATVTTPAEQAAATAGLTSAAAGLGEAAEALHGLIELGAPGNTGRPGSDRTLAGPGGRLAMGEALVIEARQERGCAIVTAAGEIDIATATRLRERLFELAAGGRPLVADLDQVRFIDSAGLSALAGAANRAAAHGGSLHVVCARPQIRQLFRLTGLDRRLCRPAPWTRPWMPCWRPGAHPASRPRRRPGPQAPVPGGRGPRGHAVRERRLPPPGPQPAPSHRGGPCHEAVRAPGHAAPCTAVKHPRPGRSRASRSPTSGNCSRAGLLARIVVLERDFQPGRTAVILARQPSPRASPVTLVMCPGTPLRPAVGTAPKPPASLAVPCW